MRTIQRWAVTPVAILLLAGCGGRDENAAATKTAEDKAAPSSRTLVAELKGDNGALARVISNAGLETALDGVGPYTLFAPPEAALKSSVDFTDPAMKAEGAALLRAHVVPGTLTRADIAAAIDRAGAKGVDMRTMAGGVLTFTRDGEAIVATAPDGASARLTGKESLVKNGVVQPTDGLLVKASAAPG
jgi:uncharacterized surface protein with fasciclin (FAS1) repeats